MLVDSHAHLDFSQFDADRAIVLERARAAGIVAIVNVGADLQSSRRAVELAQAEPMVYASVGVHPHDARLLDGRALAELRGLAGRPKVVAIGEIGLDYYRDLSPRDAQRQAFRTQLDWAAHVVRPVIVHDRDAHEPVLSMLEEWVSGLAGSPLAGRAGILHSFSGDLAMAERAIALGFYISISGPVTYHNARRLPDIVAALPLDRLLIETDCPYLPPHPYRGQRNEPAYVQLVAERIAAIRGVAVDEIAAATTANAGRVFGIEL